MRRIVNSQALQIGAFDERPELAPCLDERLLHEIVGAIEIAAKRDGEGAQIGNHGENVGRYLGACDGIGDRVPIRRTRLDRPLAARVPRLARAVRRMGGLLRWGSRQFGGDFLFGRVPGTVLVRNRH